VVQEGTVCRLNERTRRKIYNRSAGAARKMPDPTLSKGKKYADFTKSFDTGLKDIVDGIANVTNADQGRIEGIDYHIDWAQDWGYEKGLLMLRYTLVEHSKELPFTILTEIIVFCNEDATARYRQYKAADLDWVGRLKITEVLNEFAEKNDLRMVLTDQRQNAFEFSAGGLADNRRYDVLVKSRWLGEDTGNDILVNIGNHLTKLKTYIKSICRPLTEEEKRKIVAIINS
jgi:hypothetical protein